MSGWMWWALAAEWVGLVFAVDWARRELKFGGRMADYRLRSGRVYLAPPAPEEWNAGYLAALIHARAAGDVVVAAPLSERIEAHRLALDQAIADPDGWSRKVVPIR